MSSGRADAVKDDAVKPFGVDVARASTNQSARVLPWLSGMQWMGVTWLNEVFGVRTTPIMRKVGKKQMTVGHNFYASFAAVVCNGPVDRIKNLKFDDRIEWTGSIDRTPGEDYVDITIETRGVFRLYWGTETQIMDARLEESGLMHSAYRGQCYIVGDDIFLGADRTTVPNLQVEVGRVGYPEWLKDVAVIRQSNGHFDANPIAIIWEWWTNKRFGRGRSETELDIPRLTATATQLYNEGLGISVPLTESSQIRSLLIQMMEYIDGYPTSYNGKFGVDLIRATGQPVPRLRNSALIGDPQITSQTWDETINKTLVSFHDSEKENQDSAAPPYYDLANLDITQAVTAKQFDRPWITRSDIATKIAGAIGRVRGLPQTEGKLQALESDVEHLDIGSIFSLATRDGSLLELRVTERAEPAHDKSVVELSFESDRGWANSGYYSPGNDPVPAPTIYAPSAAFAVKFIDAPYAFVYDRIKKDASGLLYMVARNDTISTEFDVWRAPESGGPYTAASERPDAPRFDRFSVVGILVNQYLGNTSIIDTTTGIRFRVTGPDEDLLTTELDLEDALNHELLAFIGETEADSEIVSLFDIVSLGNKEYTAKCVRALYDTTVSRHNPSTAVWIQERSQLALDVWAPYVSSARFYKIQTMFGVSQLDLSEVNAISHTESARALKPLPPKGLKVNGDGVAPTWQWMGPDLTVTWTNTARASTIFGRPMGEGYETDLTAVELEILTQAGDLLTTLTVPATGSYVLTNAAIRALTNQTFRINARGVRNSFESNKQTGIIVSIAP